MKRLFLALLLSVGATLPTCVNADGVHADTGKAATRLSSVHLREGEAFVPARTRLIRQGWKPVRVHSKESEYIGPDTREMARTFREVDSCSMDTASCIMYYKKSDKCLRVDTIGETPKAMKVVAWSGECFVPSDALPAP